MPPSPERVTACARTWLGTRFHHQGRLKKTAQHAGGVDCLGLLMGVAAELGLHGRSGTPLAQLDRTDYAHLPNGEALRAALRAELLEIPQGGISPADILLFSLEDTPRHLALATEGGMLHAYAQARRVVEHPLDGWWQARICAAFRLP